MCYRCVFTSQKPGAQTRGAAVPPYLTKNDSNAGSHAASLLDSHCAHCASDNTSFNLNQAAALASGSPPHPGQKIQQQSGGTALPIAFCQALAEFGADLTSFSQLVFACGKKGLEEEGKKKPNKPHREVGSSPFMHVRTKPACPWARQSCAGTTPAPQVGAR